MNNAPLHSDRNCLCAVARAELFHDVLDVNLDGLLGYEELLGNVTIPVPLSDPPENFNFPRTQTLRAHVLGKLSSDIRRDTLLAGMHMPDRLYQFVGRRAL